MNLRIKVLLPLLCFSLMLVAYLYGYWMPRSFTNTEIEYHRSTERHLDSVAEGLVPLLLGHALDTIYENLNALMRNNKDWVSIQLINADGRMLYPLKPPPQLDAGNMQDVKTFEKQINYLNIKLGKLILREDCAPRLSVVRKRHRELMVILLVIIVAFFLTIGLMLDIVVSRPVKILALASRRLADGDFDMPLQKRGRDEIGALVENFSNMRDAIHGYQAEILHKNQLLTKLSLAVEQSPVSIVITDANGTIEYVNPKFTQITGYGQNEAVGQNPRILKSGETPPEVYKTLWECITSGKVWRGEFHNRKKNGELFWESAAISPLKNPEGIITHYIAIKEDITGQKKLEEQLRQSQKLEAVGQLAGGIAHDFNNMLTAIIGYCNLLQMKLEEDNPLKPFVNQILSSAEKSANLTRQLLAFSRKQIISPRETNLKELIKGVEKLLSRLIGEDIELKTIFSDDDLTVMVDAGQLEQVLMNLCNNARDAMPRGGLISITTDIVELDENYIKTYAIERPGKYASISVTDTGAGMDENTRQRIFEPFFTTKELGRGTGLGLSIVYGIVKQHNGHITVYSEPGRGTTFKIFLPLIKPSLRASEADEMIALTGGTETILVAEDNEVVRAVTKALLEKFGYKIIEAVDGEDALIKFMGNKDDIRLVIVDVIMPKKNGKEVYEEIMKIRHDMKVLFISGYTADIIHQKGIVEEELDFISKPITSRNLLTKVREILNRETGG